MTLSGLCILETTRLAWAHGHSTCFHHLPFFHSYIMGSAFSPVWLSLVLQSSLPHHWPNLWLPFIPPRIATSEPSQWFPWALSSCNYQVVPILSNLSHSADVWQSRPPPNCHQINEDTHLVLLTLGKWWYVKCNEEIVWSDIFYTYPAPNSRE